MTPKYEIGSNVWWSTFQSEPDTIVCPDCGGTAQITCILWDGTELSIECEGCKRGYGRANGRINIHNRRANARLVVIEGMEISRGDVTYYVDGSYRVEESRLFDTESAALEAATAEAIEYAIEYDRVERDRINHKEKPTKSWSWHVHYHRREIKRMQESIEYHTSCLNVAKVKAKEPAE